MLYTALIGVPDVWFMFVDPHPRLGSAMSDQEERPPSTCSGRLCLDLSVSSPADAVFLAPFQDQLQRAVDVLGKETPLAGEVRVRLVRDAEMAALHERHSGIPGTTDVLTFDLREDPADASLPLDVDLILCVDEAKRQSSSRSIPLEAEMTLYAIHGLLHALGHDDHDEHAYREMHAREDRILSAAGLGAIFSMPDTRESDS
jgi:probable rRNA maturation factor